MRIIGKLYAVAGLAAACVAAIQSSYAGGQDRLDFGVIDGKFTSVFADDVESLTFMRTRNGYDRMRLLMKDGQTRYVPFSGCDRVVYSPENTVSRFTVSLKADYNMSLASDVADAAMGETCEFESNHWYVPSALHVYGDYTGKDYNASEGFLKALEMPDCHCPARFSFTMPFEPVTIVSREWHRTLYNGIEMPEEWPPRDMNHGSFSPMPVPYLENRPAVVDVSVGRQLFVDDFLIESTDLERVFHKPVKYEGNPILSAVESDMTAKTPGATAKDGGVWWEPREGRYKMWYEAGWYGKMALAVSDDGLTWTRPDIGDGSNILTSVADIRCNSSSVVLDYDAPDEERYKMFIRSPNATATDFRGWSLTSADGIDWGNRTATGKCGDKSTMFYNPFRKRWVYSIRSVDLANEPFGRARYYLEHPDFLAGADWGDDEPVFWCQADSDDPRDPEFKMQPQLYNLQAVAYESLMLGMHQILLDENAVAISEKRPKITELKVGFSRDGFHWDRPYRESFINASRTEGSWDRGYVQSVGGVCAVKGDELLIYYIGFAGGGENVTASNGATGVAVMRRDGFASMETAGRGTLTTRVLRSDAPDYLFVNADCAKGNLRVDVLDVNGNLLGGFSEANCVPVDDDSTIHKVSWSVGSKEVSDLSSVLAPGVGFRLRFHVNNGKLYSFWLSPSEKGESRGYVGAGGPGYISNVDDKGIDAYVK